MGVRGGGIGEGARWGNGRFRARLDWSGRKRVGKIEITRSRKAKMRRCENGVVSWVGAFKIHASEEKPFGRWRYEIRSR